MIAWLKSCRTELRRLASRTPFSDAPRRSTGLLPSITDISRAASSTVWVSGPTVSKRAQSGTTPFRDSRPEVVFSPTRSFHAAGTRTDPPVSEPMAAGASPKATEPAAPEDDPPASAS